MGFLETEEDGRKLYLLAGTNEAPSGAKLVPRFLSIALALEMTEGILVWTDPVESFVLVMERGFPGRCVWSRAPRTCQEKWGAR